MRALREAVAFAGALAAAAALAQTITFGDAAPGKLPQEFEIGLTGGGPPPRWEIVPDPSAVEGKALAQLSTDQTDLRFPARYPSLESACGCRGEHAKAMSGKLDQAGGLAVRLKDQNNYYVTRANALEDNVRFYRVVNGRRQQLASANVKVVLDQHDGDVARDRGDQGLHVGALLAGQAGERLVQEEELGMLGERQRDLEPALLAVRGFGERAVGLLGEAHAGERRTRTLLEVAPAAACVISAIENALTPFGVRIAQHPVSPVQIVELIDRADYGELKFGLAH